MAYENETIPELDSYYLPEGATGRERHYSANGKASFGFAIGLDDDAFVVETEQEELTIDDNLALAGILESEKTRFKENLFNKALSDFDAESSVPNTPNTSPLLSQMKAGNDLKQKQHEREIMLAKAEIEYKKADIQAKLKSIKLQEDANAIQLAHLSLQGQIYLQNERVIKQNSTLLTNVAKLKSVIASKDSNQTQTNEKIIEGIENQIETNNKTLEKLNQQLEKNISINGTNYNSLEVEKMKNKEVYQGAKDENEMELNEFLDGIVEETLTDGFDVNVNPLVTLLESVKTDFEKQIRDIKVLYNINDKGMS